MSGRNESVSVLRFYQSGLLQEVSQDTAIVDGFGGQDTT